MADPSNKVPENVAGPWFVDDECIECGLCLDVAPKNFDLADEGHAYVSKQPVGQDEESAVRDAMEQCPVDAIGES